MCQKIIASSLTSTQLCTVGKYQLSNCPAQINLIWYKPQHKGIYLFPAGQPRDLQGTWPALPVYQTLHSWLSIGHHDICRNCVGAAAPCDLSNDRHNCSIHPGLCECLVLGCVTLCVTDSCLRVEARPGYFRVDLLHAVLNKLAANVSLVLLLTVVNFARPTCVIVACPSKQQ